jgi:antitoxin component YwqK of YwqJK toxin-antitoxin module
MKKVIPSLVIITCMLFPATAFSQAAGDTNKVDANNQKQGIWKENIAFFDWYGRYVDDQKEGSWVMYHPGNIVGAVEVYKNGKKNGVSISLDRNGSLAKEEHYVEGQIDGVARYYKSGKMSMEAVYKMGALNGVKKTYYDNGRVQEESTFVNGKREGAAKWYNMDGKVNSEYNYKGDNLHGPFRFFHKNGNIEKEGTYKDNEFDGKFYEYYENGKVKQEGQYVKGKKEGAWKEYNEEGKLVKTLKFRNDAQVK